MGVTTLIIIATFAYAAFQFFSAKAGGKVDGALAPLVTNVVNVTLLTVFVASLKASKIHFLPTQRGGLVYSSLAGIFIAIFIVAFNKIFQYGGNLSVVSPLIFGAAIVLSTLLSVAFLKESIGFYHLIGIAMVVGGIGLIALARAR